KPLVWKGLVGYGIQFLQLRRRFRGRRVAANNRVPVSGEFYTNPRTDISICSDEQNAHVMIRCMGVCGNRRERSVEIRLTTAPKDVCDATDASHEALHDP